MNIFLTGAAGFIGFHAATALLARGHSVTGVDVLNAYYDPALKQARLARLEGRNRFRFVKADIATDGALEAAAGGEHYDIILHLAAQAGVRYALKEPKAYTHSNLVGHHNVLEFARDHEGLQHLVYASSSSVYGNDSVAPFSEDQRADHPVSYYGATKRAGELLSYSYAELFGLKQTGLRFFTVYGDWGRPDMAYWLFTDAILHGRTLPVFGQGKLRRDFTHVDDIVAALMRIVETPYAQDAGQAPHRVFNLGNSHPETVLDLIQHIEAAAGRKAVIEWTDGPQGDVRETYADISRAHKAFGFSPRVPLADGIERFVRWYRQYTGL
ncbi:MAG: NAD-dependent epimerase/dehydratase family protein [Alphaproteobacteria bacterium]|nr:NAD-dependent epimerase/dehydratase family protein [Alphaproteobacteria bacterium]